MNLTGSKRGVTAKGLFSEVLLVRILHGERLKPPPKWLPSTVDGISLSLADKLLGREVLVGPDSHISVIFHGHELENNSGTI